MSSIKKYKVGDIVRCIKKWPDGNSRIEVGSIGRVCNIDRDRIGVEWDDDVLGHDCHKTCSDSHGWYVDDWDIELEPADDDCDGISVDDMSFDLFMKGSNED